MLIARLDDGTRVLPTPGRTDAACPLCGGGVIAKCGRIVVPHFAHRSDAECDPWGDPETRWHRRWKSQWPADRQEVVLKDHRADALTAGGRAVEFQHSSLDPDVVAARERFYVSEVGGWPGCSTWSSHSMTTGSSWWTRSPTASPPSISRPSVLGWRTSGGCQGSRPSTTSGASCSGSPSTRSSAGCRGPDGWWTGPR